VSTGGRLRLVGPLLPSREHRTLEVADGLVVASTSSPAPADDVAVLTGWLVPGLVDAHCHVGLGPAGAVDQDRTREQATADRDAGALLLRDAGSPADTRWVDAEPDLPRLVRAGRHIARTRRYYRGFAAEVEPADLVTEVTRQAAAGDGWVKVVADWIDRDLGDLAPCWPDETLRAAVQAAHAAGARLTVHVFGEDAMPGVLAAGVDGIEHGIGLSDDELATAAERGIALVPTRVQIANFPLFAAQGEARFPRWAAHLRALHARADDLVRRAHEAGVAIFGGTDAGGTNGHGLLPTEVAMLAAAGMGGTAALAAASWRAWAWLGRDDGVSPGSSADLVVYPADPRADPAVLQHPSAVVLRGRVVLRGGVVLPGGVVAEPVAGSGASGRIAG